VSARPLGYLKQDPNFIRSVSVCLLSYSCLFSIACRFKVVLVKVRAAKIEADVTMLRHNTLVLVLVGYHNVDLHPKRRWCTCRSRSHTILVFGSRVANVVLQPFFNHHQLSSKDRAPFYPLGLSSYLLP
jgi:hypothetical protein